MCCGRGAKCGCQCRKGRKQEAFNFKGGFLEKSGTVQSELIHACILTLQYSKQICNSSHGITTDELGITLL